MFCSSCGNKNRDGIKFCGYCGTAIAADATPIQNSVVVEPESTPALTENVAPPPTPQPQPATSLSQAKSEKKAATGVGRKLAYLAGSLFATLVVIGVLVNLLKMNESTPDVTAPTKLAALTHAEPTSLSATQVAIAEQSQPSAESKSEAPPSAVDAESQTETVEQEGICNGIDTDTMIGLRECLDKKYTSTDKDLNDVYKQIMAGLDAGRKATLKTEQIAWIKEKEAKCEEAAKEFEGGAQESVSKLDCFVSMTEKRLSYLKSYK